MDRVLDRLFIGSTGDEAAPLRELGFSAALDLREKAGEFPGLMVHSLGRRDGDPWTAKEAEEALVFLHEQIRLGKVLVLCVAGLSRSASMVIAYLVRCGWDAASAYKAVRRARPAVLPFRDTLAAVLQVAHPGLGVRSTDGVRSTFSSASPPGL